MDFTAIYLGVILFLSASILILLFVIRHLVNVLYCSNKIIKAQECLIATYKDMISCYKKLHDEDET